jgi:hypothetical protein
MAYRERYFLAQPIPTDQTDTTTIPGQTLAIYLDGESRQPMKWSAKFPLPTVGTRVFVTMNSLGWAKIVGYWEGCDWLGVMTKLEKPPTWLRKQRDRELRGPRAAFLPQWAKDGIGCETGTEFLLAKPCKRIYVGCNQTHRITFRSAENPTTETHGHLYNAVIGPFRTMRGARWMATYGANNPHCQTVADAERLATAK